MMVRFPTDEVHKIQNAKGEFYVVVNSSTHKTV
jgi:hypothetical protein